MESRTPEERRSRFMAAALPIGMVSVFVLAVGSFLAITYTGGEAKGERVEIRWSSECPEAWMGTAGARAKEIGLGSPELKVDGSETVLVATLPGNEDDMTAIPALMTRSGAFGIFEAESQQGPPVGEALATNVDITSLWFNIDYSGHAYTQVELQAKAFERVTGSSAILVFMVDDEVAGSFEHEDPADPDDLRLQDASAETKEDEVRSAIDWKILVGAPSECEAGAASVRVLEG